MWKSLRGKWLASQARMHVLVGLWLLNRRLDLIEWRFRFQALFN